MGFVAQARALITHTESGLKGYSPADRYLQAVQDACRNTNGEKNAAAVMNEGILLEALGPKARPIGPRNGFR